MIRNSSELSILEIALDLFGPEYNLKKQKYGTKYKMLCPFHEERHPSFFIMTKRNFYRCYGCGSEGGPVTLVYNLFKDQFETLMYLEFAGLNLGRDEKQIDLLLEQEFFEIN